MNQYGNYERRAGNTNEWSDEEVLTSLSLFLLSKYPDAEEGQKYAVTISIYNGAAGTETWRLIKKGDAYEVVK
jgi:hypothetical protein